MESRKRRISAPVGALLGLAGAASAQSITGLGNLPGANGTLARGVSNGGAVVVGQTSMSGSPLPWRWTPAGGMQVLNYVGYAFGIAADGSVVVGEQGVAPSQAVRWTTSGGMQGLGWLSPTHTRSTARAASADGSVIVGTSGLGTEMKAFRWTQAGGLAALGFLPGHTHSTAGGVSADGTVVVGASYFYMPGGAYPQEGFRFTQGAGMVGVGFLPGKNASAASAVSADGTTVVGGSYVIGVPGTAPFRWTQAGGIENLGMLPGSTACNPLSVSGDGSIVVGSCIAAVPFIWTAAGGMRPLTDALVNEFGINPAGVPESFLVVLPASCYANCDGSTGAPVLNVNDFVCFQTRFAAADARADCDHSSSLNVLDFVCFQAAFAAGCP